MVDSEHFDFNKIAHVPRLAKADTVAGAGETVRWFALPKYLSDTIDGIAQKLRPILAQKFRQKDGDWLSITHDGKNNRSRRQYSPRKLREDGTALRLEEL